LRKKRNNDSTAGPTTVTTVHCQNVQHEYRPKDVVTGRRTHQAPLRMDAEGARALARRIAQEEARKGKPPADPQPMTTERPASESAEKVYVRPVRARRSGDVRIYVQGPDGRLRPFES
jgi:hypothetical protein